MSFLSVKDKGDDNTTFGERSQPRDSELRCYYRPLVFETFKARLCNVSTPSPLITSGLLPENIAV